MVVSWWIVAFLRCVRVRRQVTDIIPLHGCPFECLLIDIVPIWSTKYRSSHDSSNV